MQSLEQYKAAFLNYMNAVVKTQQPDNLYAPIEYIMKLGGKRLRPIVAMMSAELFGGDSKDTLPVALAIEMFHNFSLVHDDIMDQAVVRRGKSTVHTKWDLNTGILSGDAMLILAYKYLEVYDNSIFKELFITFNQIALEVCEGQQYDIDFETKKEVPLDLYFKMIGYKTAVLLAGSFKMGAIVAKSDKQSQDSIYDFGFNLGIAFQLQDDYLDTFGDQEVFGKRIGGDIVENKKTFLFIELQNCVDSKDQLVLNELLKNDTNEKIKIQTVRNLYLKYGIDNKVQQKIEFFISKAETNINQLKVTQSSKQVLFDLLNYMLQRQV